MSHKKVHKIVKIGKQDDYVYKVETETRDFICGFPLIIHNTDSFAF